MSRISFGRLTTIDSQFNTLHKIVVAKGFLKITNHTSVQNTSADNIIWGKQYGES